MSSRKLVRCVSTCSDDILDEALNELSHLNQRHAVLRQQLFARRTASKQTKYRPSGSVCSSTSSSSSSSTSTNSSSMCSSFSSSMSATMSSSESWDSFSDCSAADMSSPMSTSMDFASARGLSRRLSKPKVNMYRPYCKPRRFSLQLVSHPESPETGDDLNADGQSSTGAVKPHFLSMSGRCQTPPKYSRLVSEKENFSSGSGGSPVKVKSNPTSPSKCDLSAAVLLDHTFVQFNAINDRLMAAVGGNPSIHCSSQPPFGGHPMTSSSGVLLIRSKSLDDLTLCTGVNPFTQQCQSSSTLAPPKPTTTSMATASSCDIDNVLQRISTLQV